MYIDNIQDDSLCVCVYVCASHCLIPGGVAAFVTTPLDVAKTRIMLAKVSLTNS